jgi:hypothetical protein
MGGSGRPSAAPCKESFPFASAAVRALVQAASPTALRR